MGTTIHSLPLGSILGCVALPAHVMTHAKKLGDEMFAAAEEQDFSGDPVETYSVPTWAMRDGAAWLPSAPEGWRYAGPPQKGLLIASASVDAHTDDEGLVLMVTLHNEGLTFVHGRVRHQPKPGEWFVFDDRRPHSLKEARGRTTFVGWHRPLLPA